MLLRNGIPVARIAPVAGPGLPAKDFLARWQAVPRLGREEAEAVARDIATGREALLPLRSAWE